MRTLCLALIARLAQPLSLSELRRVAFVSDALERTADGLRCARPFAGTALAAKRSACLAATSWEGPPDGVERDAWAGCSCRERLAVKLARAWRDGGAEALPPRARAAALPVHWSPEALRRLGAPDAVARANRDRARRRELRELGGGDALDDACDVVASHALEGRFGANGLARVLAVAAPAAAAVVLALPFLADADAEALASAPPTRATFLAAIAAGLAASRDDALLLPGADLLAPTGAPTAARYDVLRDEIAVAGAAGKGEALARDYGERPNLELLLAHGVCLADNAHDDRRLTAAGAEATLRRGGDIDADGAHFRAAAASDLAHLVALQEEGAAGDPPAAVAYRAGQILLLREFLGD